MRASIAAAVILLVIAPAEAKRRLSLADYERIAGKLALRPGEAWEHGERAPCPLVGGEAMEVKRRATLAAAIRRTPGLQDTEDLRCPRAAKVAGQTIDLWIAEDRAENDDILRTLIVTPRGRMAPTATISLSDPRSSVEGNLGQVYLARDRGRLLALSVVWTTALYLQLFEITGVGQVRWLTSRNVSHTRPFALRFVPVRRREGLGFRLLFLTPGRTPDKVSQLQHGDLHVERIEVYDVRAGGLVKIAAAP